MINKLILMLGLSLLSFGCSTAKVKTNDFQGIDYAVNVPEGYKKITMVEIRKKGKVTTIEALMPALKESVTELNFVRNVVISNVKTIPFPKLKKEVKKIKACAEGSFSKSVPSNIRKTDKNGRPTGSRRQVSYGVVCKSKSITKNQWLDYFQITADVFAYPETISL